MTNSFAAAALVALVGIAGNTANAQSDPRIGCYRADRPLGSSASADGVRGPIGEQMGEAGAGLWAMATFRLLEGGRVDRPGTVTHELWRHDSRWVVARDTLNVRLPTMASGWNLTLVPARTGSDSEYAGEARYMIDVIVVGGPQPPRVPVRVSRELCETLSDQSSVIRNPPDGVILEFVRFANLFGSRLVTAFDSIPADKYDYRPTPVQQTVGYIAQHLESANYSLCERLGDLKPPRTAKLPPRRRTAIELPAASLSSYVGVYQLAAGVELDVSMRDSMIFIRPNTGGGAVRLWPESRDEFFVGEADAQVSFTRTASGAISGLVLHQDGRHRPAAKVR